MTYNEELRFRQNRFATHVSYLINFIQSPERGLTLSLGRATDIPEVQPILIAKGLSNILDSQHSKRLAIDLNFFDETGYYLFSNPDRKIQDLEQCEPIFAYWELLDKDNRCGARWNKPFDPYHFENYFK